MLALLHARRRVRKCRTVGELGRGGCDSLGREKVAMEGDDRDDGTEYAEDS